MERTLLNGRLVVSGRAAAVAIGDVVAIAAFVAAGELQHAGTVAAGALTFVEFLAGWAIAAVAAGAYSAGSIDSPDSRGVAVAVAAWVVAAILGQVIRATVEPADDLTVAFTLVSIGVGGVLIGGWRLVAARAFGNT